MERPDVGRRHGRLIACIVGLLATLGIVIWAIDSGKARRGGAEPRVNTLVLSPASTGTAPTPQVRAVPTATLYVQVQHAGATSAIAGARCRIDSASDNHSFAERATGVEGVAKFVGLPTGTALRVTTTMHGYQPDERLVKLEERATHLQIDLSGTGSVFGVVRDQDGNRLPSVRIYAGRVRIRGWKTRGDGRFALTGMPAREISLTFVRRGCESKTMQVDATQRREIAVTLVRYEPLQVRLVFPEFEGLEKTLRHHPIQIAGFLRSDDRVLYGGTLNLMGSVLTKQFGYKEDDRVDTFLRLPEGSRIRASGQVGRVEGKYVAEIVVDNAAPVHALLVDEGGNPYSDTDFLYFGSNSGDPLRGSCTSDAEGRCVLIAPKVGGTPVPIRFSTHGSISDSVQLTPRPHHDPLLVRFAGAEGVIALDLGTFDDPTLTKELRLEESQLGAGLFGAGRRAEDGLLEFGVPEGTYRVLWRRSPVTAFEIRAQRGKRTVFELSRVLGAGAITASCGGSHMCTLWRLDKWAQRPVGRLVPEPSGRVEFVDLIPGEYMLAVDFPRGQRVARRCVLRTGTSVDLGEIAPEETQWINIRLMNRDGTPLANESVELRGAPSRGHLNCETVTDASGIGRAPCGKPPWFVLSMRNVFGIVQTLRDGRPHDLVYPDTQAALTLRIPAEIGIPESVYWMASRHDRTVTWFVELEPTGTRQFGLPRCTGLQYFIVNGAADQRFRVARVRDGRVEFLALREFTVPANSLPPLATWYSVRCLSLGGRDTTMSRWVDGPRSLPGGDLSVLVPINSSFKVTLGGRGPNQRWEGVIDAKVGGTQLRLDR